MKTMSHKECKENTLHYLLLLLLLLLGLPAARVAFLRFSIDNPCSLQHCYSHSTTQSVRHTVTNVRFRRPVRWFFYPNVALLLVNTFDWHKSKCTLTCHIAWMATCVPRLRFSLLHPSTEVADPITLSTGLHFLVRLFSSLDQSQSVVLKYLAPSRLFSATVAPLIADRFNLSPYIISRTTMILL